MLPLLRLPQPLPGFPVPQSPLLLRPVVLVHILTLQLPDDIERLGVAFHQPDDLKQPLHADEMLRHQPGERRQYQPGAVLPGQPVILPQEYFTIGFTARPFFSDSRRKSVRVAVALMLVMVVVLLAVGCAGSGLYQKLRNQMEGRFFRFC